MKEEFEKKAEEYGYAEANKLLKINENCHTHFSFSRADISKAFQDGAKWGYDKALKELVERVEKDQAERQVQTINVIELNNDEVLDKFLKKAKKLNKAMKEDYQDYLSKNGSKRK